MQVNDDYLMYLMELDKKLKYAHEDDIAVVSQAKRDLEPALEKLRVKALAKVCVAVSRRFSAHTDFVSPDACSMC